MLHLDRFITTYIPPVNITIVTGADAVESALDFFFFFFFLSSERLLLLYRPVVARFFESRALDRRDRFLRISEKWRWFETKRI